MITRMSLTNFKHFKELDIEVGSVTLLVGPNNTGKTTVLQALTLWDLALNTWYNQKFDSKARQRTGVTLARQDFYAIPVPETRLLWYGLHTRSGTPGATNVLMTMELEGVTDARPWRVGIEYYYANPQSIYARPKRGLDNPEDIACALKERFAFLPPMSGLAAFEERLEEGSIKRRIGEGRTAEVLRNLIWKIFAMDDKGPWKSLKKTLREHFLVELSDPKYNPATSIITCAVKENDGPEMDITATGRGFQQMLLLFSFLHAQPYTVLLLDEPDAHLEVLRQQHLYQSLVTQIKANNAQLLIATHSEAMLDLAVQEDTVIAFIGTPHQPKRPRELKKALVAIPYIEYLKAEQQKRVLFLEGETDLRILRSFAQVLEHPVLPKLDAAFIKYLNSNDIDAARDTFTALQEAYPELKGVVLTDALGKSYDMPPDLSHLQWRRKEIECYLPLPMTLYRVIDGNSDTPESLFEQESLGQLRAIVEENTPPAALRSISDDFWKRTKVSDDWLKPILERYYALLGLPVKIRKGDYFLLAQKARPEELDGEIIEKLDVLNEFLS